MRRQSSPRDADWRFLLPAAEPYRHLLLLGGPAGLKEQLLGYGTARRVSSGVPSDEPPDVVVRLHDGPDGVEATGQLQEGAVVYWEVLRPARRLTARRRSPRRRLRSHGLRVMATYWIRPASGAPRWHVPLDARGAAMWVLRKFVSPSTPVALAARPLLLAASAMPAIVLRPFVRRYALVAAAGGVVDTARPLPILDHAEIPSEVRQPAVRPVLFGPGDENRLVLFPMLPASRQPAAVVKLWRSAEGNYRTQQEQRVLRSLHSALDGPLAASIPRPLGIGAHGAVAFGLESHASGRPLSSILRTWGMPWRRKVHWLQRISEWLEQFQRATACRWPRWGEPEPREWVTGAIARYTEAFDGLTPVEAGLFHAAEASLESLSAHHVPVVMNHWGIAATNVFADRRHGLTVIDWEGGSEGAPLLDLLFWILDWARLAVPEQDEEIRFRRTFLAAPSDPVRRASMQATSHYLAALDIDARAVPLMLVVLLATRALWRTDGDEYSRESNPYARYLDLAGRATGTLFGDA